MTHFGIICPAAIGHLNPMCALGSELQRRGHQVTLFGIVDIQSKVEATELDFYLIGEEQFPLGSLTQYYNKLGKMSGKEGLGYTIQFLVREAQMLFKSLPNAIATTGIEVLIIDQISRAGSTVADKFKLPYVTVCNALLVNREAGVPPYFTSWSYSTAWWNNRRNQLGNYLLGRIAKPITQTIDQQRQDRVDAEERQRFIEQFWPVLLGVALLVLFSFILGIRYYWAMRTNRKLSRAQLSHVAQESGK